MSRISSELTLQKATSLYVLSNLRSFSTRTLSMLPIQIRQELLLNTPVYEMWILEQSEFVDGINMTGIWASITKQRMPVSYVDKLNIPPIDKCSHCAKKKYMETLGFIILNKACNNTANTNYHQLALDLIFSVHNSMNITNWRKFLGMNPYWRRYFHSFPPPRQHIIVPTKYFKYYNGLEISDVQLISLLLNGCHYKPTQINIYAPSFLNTHIWKEIKYPSVLESVRRYFSSAESLWYCSSGSVEPISEATTVKAFPNMLSFIVTEMITSSGVGSEIGHIHLQAPNVRSLSLLLQSIAYFFAVITNFESSRTKNCTPYKQLKELTLMHDEQPQHVAIDMPSLDCLFRNMADIIVFQPYLNKVSLEGINFAYMTHNLVAAFVQQMNRGTGSTLFLNACHMKLDFFQVIVETFLRSQLASNQVLHLSKVVVDRASLPKNSELTTSAICMSEEGFNYKYYKFSDMHLPHPSMLLHTGHQIRLHTLELHNVRVDPGYRLLDEIAQHPNFKVRHIYLSKINIPHCNITVKNFKTLLVKTDLEVLSICDCNIGETGVLQDITIAFSLLFSYRYSLVSVLNLKDNRIGDESDEILQNFFAALFGMHGIRALGLDIRSNQLKPQHFKIMVSEWKRCAGDKKLRQLHCQGNEVAPNQKTLIAGMSQWTFF